MYQLTEKHITTIHKYVQIFIQKKAKAAKRINIYAQRPFSMEPTAPPLVLEMLVDPELQQDTYEHLDDHLNEFRWLLDE